MSRPTDVPSVDTSDAEPHAADREYASPQSQLTELVGRSFYGDYIVNSHEECSKCVVLILFRRRKDPAKKVTNFQTGIIIAAGKESCCIITSSLVHMKDQVCEVQFCDGTKWAVKNTSVQKEIGMSVLLVYNVSMAKAKAAKFVDSAINSGEKVFTCGYSSSLNGRSFFSGSITSGVGMKDKTVKKATVFVHGCATGNNGHLGSAVFNERQNLVGMNVLYTCSSGYDYRLPLPTKGDGKDADLGGIVYALDLASIRAGFALVGWKKTEGKTIHEIVKWITDSLLLKEDKRKGG